MTAVLDDVYAALANPIRRELVRQLAEGEATVSDLAAPHATSFQSISQHIKVLETAGLVSRGRAGRTRPCRLEPAVLASAVSWIEDARSTWAGRMDRLEAHLTELQPERG